MSESQALRIRNVDNTAKRTNLMGWNDQTEGEGFTAFLREIVRSNRLDDAALGITKKLIDEGKESLSEEQQFVFQEYVLNVFVKEACNQNCPIPWSEMFDAYENGGWCGTCISRKPKNP